MEVGRGAEGGCDDLFCRHGCIDLDGVVIIESSFRWLILYRMLMRTELNNRVDVACCLLLCCYQKISWISETWIFRWIFYANIQEGIHIRMPG